MEAHSPDPDSGAVKSKRDRKTRINDENNAPVGEEEDGKMNPSKRMKTAIARLRKERSLREVNGQEADGGTGDADTPGKSSDGSEGIMSRFRTTKKSGKGNELSDLMHSPDSDAKDKWMLELGWTKLESFKEAHEVQKENERRRKSYSIQDKKKVIAKLPTDCFLGKKSLKEGGRPLYDDEKKINLHFLVGLYKELCKDDQIAEQEGHMQVRFLAREAIRLKIISHREAKSGRIPLDRLKKAAQCGYNLNNSLLQIRDADPGADDSLISSTTAKALQELRFPPKKRVAQPKPKGDSSEVPNHEPLGKDTKQAAPQADDDDNDSEDERRAQRERLDEMSGNLRTKAIDRKGQILTADANTVNLAETANQLMGPSLSFDWGNEEDSDDDLQIKAPDENGKPDMRQMMQDHLRRQIQAQTAKKWSKQKSSDSITTKSSRQKSSDSLGRSVSEGALSEGVVPAAAIKEHPVNAAAGQAAGTSSMAAGDACGSKGSDEDPAEAKSEAITGNEESSILPPAQLKTTVIQMHNDSGNDEAPAVSSKGEASISPTAPWTGTAMTEEATSNTQPKVFSKAETSVSPTAPWTGISPTAPFPGTARTQKVDNGTQPPVLSKAEGCISPTAPWTGISSPVPCQSSTAGGGVPPVPSKAEASISPTAPWTGITPTAPWQGTAGEEATMKSNSLGTDLSPTAMWGRNIDWDTPPPAEKSRIAEGNTNAMTSPTVHFVGQESQVDQGEKDAADEEEVDPGRFTGLLASPVCDDFKEEEPPQRARSMSQEELARAHLDEYLLREKGPQKRQTNIKSMFSKRDEGSREGRAEDCQPVVATPKAAVRPWPTSPAVFESPVAAGQGLQQRLEEAQENHRPSSLDVSAFTRDGTEEAKSNGNKDVQMAGIQSPVSEDESEQEGLEDDAELDERQRAQMMREREWRRQQRRRDRAELKKLQKEKERVAVGQIRAERAFSLGTKTMSEEDRKRWEAAFDVQVSTGEGPVRETSGKRAAPAASQDDAHHLFGVASKKSKGGLLSRKR